MFSCIPKSTRVLSKFAWKIRFPVYGKHAHFISRLGKNLVENCNILQSKSIAAYTSSNRCRNSHVLALLFPDREILDAGIKNAVAVVGTDLSPRDIQMQ